MKINMELELENNCPSINLERFLRNALELVNVNILSMSIKPEKIYEANVAGLEEALKNANKEDRICVMFPGGVECTIAASVFFDYCNKTLFLKNEPSIEEMRADDLLSLIYLRCHIFREKDKNDYESAQTKSLAIAIVYHGCTHIVDNIEIGNGCIILNAK